MTARTLVAALALSLAMPLAAQAQAPTPPAIAEGTTIFGPQGNEVGKVTKISGSAVVVNTGTHTVGLDLSWITTTAKGPTIGYTREQLEAAVDAANEKAKAALDAALVSGSALRSSDGVALGTVKSVGEDGAVLVEGSDGDFSLPRDIFATDNEGLIVRITAQQLADARAKAVAAQ